MSKNRYVIGVDFGTDSVRTILMDAWEGEMLSSAVCLYERWSKGLYCDAGKSQFRQHPLDYIEGLTTSIKRCLKEVDVEVRKQVGAISMAMTGSTPIAVDVQGTPLALLEAFSDNPNAMFVLWKDHTAIREADEINAISKQEGMDYLKYVGGIYSSEWYWAKLLHMLRADKKIGEVCYTWVEHSDWMPFLLTGGNDARKIKRNACAAGHKALWSAAFGGLPAIDFFTSIDPVLGIYAERYGNKVYTTDKSAGYLCAEWAERLGLSTKVQVGIGAIDAHVGAVGGEIKPYYISKVIGTSTCDMMVVPGDQMEGLFVKGICGQVNDSIIPGMVGLEAGQSAFGDVYSWFKDLLLWPLAKKSFSDADTDRLYRELEAELLRELNDAASKLPLYIDAPFALDWFNGRRTPDADPTRKGLIGGLSLGTTAPDIFRALVESTCFGARAIVERIESEGVKVEGVQAIGGISNKSPFVMQLLADILNRPIHIAATEQVCALGACMFAAVVCNIYATVEEASVNMGSGVKEIVRPRSEYKELFDQRYAQYLHYGQLQQDNKK
ncbi:ribulokinase [Sphingobacterium corticibacterium]|uniref:Ribulokinase n=1 Tax=Sphingobacterium corticibacterium TaxID=2484746 RepID=A0A4Q6XPA6_9SPHI|nr:ribulokinase [Sphingobacterium corticibacterium]RZF62053.1 ribulokinase [Sphingobacterium corticibacterium]